MNGRIYDPKLGRFLQADPQVQFITDTQSYNRYSYAHNNPLRYTDSSGYGLDIFDVAKIVVGVAIMATTGDPSTLAWAIGSISAVQAAHYGGSLGDIATAAFTSAAMAYFGAEFATGGFSGGELLGFSAMGGISSVLNNGKFGHGFVSAGAGASAGGLFKTGGGIGAITGKTVIRSVIGGTISKITGGKFANGAAYAAFASLMSEGAQAAKNNASEGGVTYTKRNDRAAEKALMVDADKIADSLGAPGADVDWEYSGAESINCGGTSTYGCTTTKTTTDYRGDKTYSRSIEYGYGSASPGTHNIEWRGGTGKLLTFKTGLEGAVFVTLHERAHTTMLPGAYNVEVRANLKAMKYYDQWKQ